MFSSLLKLGAGHRTFRFTLLSAVKLLTEEGARACNRAAVVSVLSRWDLSLHGIKASS